MRIYTAILLIDNRTALGIGKCSNQNHYEINQCPNTAATACEQLCYTGTGLSYIETVNTESSKEEAQQQGYQPLVIVLVLFWLIFQ